MRMVPKTVMFWCVVAFVIVMAAANFAWTAFVESLNERQLNTLLGVMIGWVITTFFAAFRPDYFTSFEVIERRFRKQLDIVRSGGQVPPDDRP